jgi:tripartite-type tricarboxylate transporter receptor subunit TctC
MVWLSRLVRRSVGIAAATAVAWLGLCPGSASAQNFPSRAVTIMVPFQTGGVADVAIRIIAQKVTENVKQPVVIDNRPGAGGIIAAEVVLKAPPDGYTLILGSTGTHAVSTALNPKLPYDPFKDFLPITLLVSTNNVLVVHSASPFRSVADIVAAARTEPGGLTFASQGIGSGGHLLGEMLKARTGVPLVHALYRGSASAMTDVVSGRVDIFFDALTTAVPLIRDGKLRALAVTSPARSPFLPDVPTMGEAGFPGVESESWFGLFAAAGTATTTIDALNREFVRAIRDADVSKRIIDRQLDIIAGTRAEFAARMKADAERLGKVVHDAGIRID